MTDALRPSGLPWARLDARTGWPLAESLSRGLAGGAEIALGTPGQRPIADTEPLGSFGGRRLPRGLAIALGRAHLFRRPRGARDPHRARVRRRGAAAGRRAAGMAVRAALARASVAASAGAARPRAAREPARRSLHAGAPAWRSRSRRTAISSSPMPDGTGARPPAGPDAARRARAPCHPARRAGRDQLRRARPRLRRRCRRSGPSCASTRFWRREAGLSASIRSALRGDSTHLAHAQRRAMRLRLRRRVRMRCAGRARTRSLDHRQGTGSTR